MFCNVLILSKLFIVLCIALNKDFILLTISSTDWFNIFSRRGAAATAMYLLNPYNSHWTQTEPNGPQWTLIWSKMPKITLNKNRGFCRSR